MDRNTATFPAFPLVALAILGGLSGCASRYKVDASAPTYAAQAKIKVKVNKTENQEMTLVIDHLAPPSRIDPSYKGYLVWIAPPGGAFTRVGLLDYDADKRRGKLVATTPHPRFDVLVSLEANRSASQPSSIVVLSKTVERS